MYRPGYDIEFYQFVVYSLECIDATKKSKKCDATAKVCVYKMMADQSVTQMCGTEKHMLPMGKTICYEMKDGSTKCLCDQKNCNGKCTPGTCTKMEMGNTTKMMDTEATKMMDSTTMASTKENGERSGSRMDMSNVKKVCEAATCEAVTITDKMTTAAKPEMTSKNGSPGKPGGDATTSDSSIAKAAACVVTGVFLLITPSFN